jgi:hypothetical protein
MAVDTRNKRASVIGIAAVLAAVLPAPDATVAQADRQHVAYCYSGIEASATNAPYEEAPADRRIVLTGGLRVITLRPDDD